MPAIFGGVLFQPSILLKTVISFVIFSMASSSVYLINDILDIEKDRLHPTKRLRPLACGKIKVPAASAISIGLAAVSLFSAFNLDLGFGVVILIYLIFNLLYSKFIRNVFLVDVFCIGLFYLLRITAGGIIAKVPLSHWIILCVLLLAFFLGFNKRRQELKLLNKMKGEHRKSLEHYDRYLIDQICSILASSVVILYTLYTVDARTVRTFGTAKLIATIPFVYYGIFRYMYLIHKKTGEGDPTRILLSDRDMIINIIFWLSTCLIIIYLKI
jgi:4-hydroxybenzoate polyprenyltransferase